MADQGEVWTIKRMLDWAQGYLAQKGDDNPRLSAQWLIGETCGLSRMELYTNFDYVLDKVQLKKLHNYIARRAAGEPLQYITGEAGFRHITLKVRPGVLIPRPETEVLVSEALGLIPAAARPRALDDRFIEALASGAARVEDEAEEGAYAGVIHAIRAASEQTHEAKGEKPLLVADICTGSGCIACSIAYEHAGTHVIATDIAPAALELARENVAALGLGERVDVVESDSGEGVAPELLGSFDLVVSNPPYVPTDVLATMPAEVTSFEPALALDGGADGLDLFRRLIIWCKAALKPGGGCAFELHETTLEQARGIALGEGFEDVRIVDDLAGRPRVLTARKPQA